MGVQTARGPNFLAICARCGGRVSGPVCFCPHCGAPAQLVFGDRTPTKKHGSRRRGVKTGAALALLAAVVLFDGAVLLHRHGDADTREHRVRSSTVQGVVTSNDMGHLNPSTTPAATAPILAPQRSQASVSGLQNEEAPSQNSTLSDRGYGDKHHRLISLALARAHVGLEKNDLRTARSGVYWALSLQPDNREALLLKRDLVSREKARDAALKAARSCVGQERRQCIWQNASNARSIDSSSAEAKALVEHSNVDSGKAVKLPGVAPVQPDAIN